MINRTTDVQLTRKRIIMAAKVGGWGSATREELCMKGYDVTRVETYFELLELLVQYHFDVALLTNDTDDRGTWMPETVSVIERCFPHVSSIVLSTHEDLKTAVELVERGVDDFISVPFDFDDLYETIDRVAASKCTVQELHHSMSNRD